MATLGPNGWTVDEGNTSPVWWDPDSGLRTIDGKSLPAAVLAKDIPSASLTASQVAATQALVSEYGNAPATLNASTGAENNGRTLSLAAGATLTVHDGAWSLLSAGIVIQVGQGGTATLAFSGTATKENGSGTSATSVTLAACGVYALTQSPSGSPKFRLTGGAAL
jgi:hypothetical protein